MSKRVVAILMNAETKTQVAYLDITEELVFEEQTIESKFPKGQLHKIYKLLDQGHENYKIDYVIYARNKSTKSSDEFSSTYFRGLWKYLMEGYPQGCTIIFKELPKKVQHAKDLLNVGHTRKNDLSGLQKGEKEFRTKPFIVYDNDFNKVSISENNSSAVIDSQSSNDKEHYNLFEPNTPLWNYGREQLTLEDGKVLVLVDNEHIYRFDSYQEYENCKKGEYLKVTDKRFPKAMTEALNSSQGNYAVAVGNPWNREQYGNTILRPKDSWDKQFLKDLQIDRMASIKENKIVFF